MKNIHVLPGDIHKPSRLYFKDGDYKLDTSSIAMDWFISSAGYKPHNIYITSDEEIKEGDWYASFIVDEKTKWETTKLDCVVKADLNKTNEYLVEPFSKYCKKIILTTDGDLIADGVQAIYDEFLEWFVKNPSCEEVEVKPYHIVLSYLMGKKLLIGYRIIIPQEESKDIPEGYSSGNFVNCMSTEEHNAKKETLEEAAERILLVEDLDLSDYDKRHILNAMLNIAKWQQEQMYSEEEVLQLLTNRSFDLKIKKDTRTTKEWFEQFKKK